MKKFLIASIIGLSLSFIYAQEQVSAPKTDSFGNKLVWSVEFDNKEEALRKLFPADKFFREEVLQTMINKTIKTKKASILKN